ncbi:MAG: long-chain-fatty-acid--CoA ligase [Sulfurovum sp.]
MNITTNLEKTAKLYPNKIALIFEKEEFSYKKLNDMSNQITNILTQLGVSSGDRVAIFLPNIPIFIPIYFAIQKFGAIAVTLNATLKEQELKYILNDCQAKVLFTTDVLNNTIPPKDLYDLKHTLIAEGDSKNGILLNDLLEQASTISRTIELNKDDPAVILYTSGTTGTPKGVTLSHHNIISNIYQTVERLNLKQNDKILLFLPIFHSYGQIVILNSTLAIGSTLILEREFEVGTILNSIQKHQVTILFGVPTIYQILSDNSSLNQLSSLKNCISAGASLPLEISEKWHKKFGLTVNELYGLTECSMVCFNDKSKYKVGSVGIAVNGTEIKIINEKEETIGQGALGEIAVKGSSIMLGYWNNPKESAQILKEGWFFTGDLGKIDKDGYLTIVDRKKDMVNVGGQNVYPNEVEQVLHHHPSILEVAVFGISESLLGEQVCATIVLKNNHRVTENEIVDFCRQSLAHYKLPSVVIFVDLLPKSKTGKILKKVLRDTYKEESSNLWQEINKIPEENRILFLKNLCLNEIKNLIGIEINDKEDFFKIGMDSLMSIQLANRLSKKLGISLTTTLTLEYPSINKLTNYLSTIIYTQTEQNSNKEEDIPLTMDIYNWFPQIYFQRRYSYIQKSIDMKYLMNLHFATRINSIIDKSTLKIVLDMLIERNEVFRLVFDTKDGIPVQKVQKEKKSFFETINLNHCQSWEEAVPEISSKLEQPFNLKEDSLIRLYLFSRAENDHIILIVAHHIVADAISLEATATELFTLYKDKKTDTSPPPLETSYIDFMKSHIGMLNSDFGQTSWNYWQEKLGDKLELLKMPTDYPRYLTNGNNSNMYYFQFSSYLSNSLKKMAKKEGVTLYTLMMSAYKLLLHLYTDQKMIVIDTNMLNRTQERFKHTIGLLTNTVTIADNISKEMTFIDLLEQVQETILGALKHQGYPNQLLVEKLQPPKASIDKHIGQVWFNLMPSSFFQFENNLANNKNFIIGDLVFTSMPPLEQWKGTFFEIELQLIEEEDKISGYINYNTNLYKDVTMKKFIQNYEELLEKIIDNSNKNIEFFKFKKGKK